MSEALIVVAALAAAVYLLAPLYGRSGRPRRLLVLLPPVLAWLALSPADAAADGEISVGLLLIAVDVQRDHLRVSEALRVVNPGPPRAIDLAIALPPGARYFTAHRGMERARPTPGGFAARLSLPRGAREVIYSYALPAGRTQRVTRSYPLAVRRVEIVVRGPGVRMRASRGAALPALEVGGARLPRWEAAELAAGAPIAVDLGGLPVSRPWFPVSAAGVLAVVLTIGLAAGARSGARPGRGEVEESPPVRRT